MKTLGLLVVMSVTLASAAEADTQVIPDSLTPTVHIRVKHVRHVKSDAGLVVDHKADAAKLKTKCFFDQSRPNFRCALRTFPDPAPGQPRLTDGAILEAVREIGLPSLKVRIQPGTSTLVNIPTIFYTQPQAFQRSVTLLGYDIDLVADPIRYTWRHGDGTTSTTSRPGKPYPSMDVTYSYRTPADTVKPRVDVTYRVRYRVDGGTWTTIGQTLLASGPAAVLEVKEAAPVLTTP